MTTRQYDFVTGIETSSAPTPTTPTNANDVITKTYGDTNYAKRSSWYDKSANNAAIKAIASGDRYDGQITFNMGNNSFYRFDSASSAADDGDTVLQPDSGTGRWLKITASGTGGAGNTLIQEFDNQVSTFKAGEALSANDAVCNEIHNGSGSDEYKIFKCDADLATRVSFAGFARSAVTATPNIKTYTISVAYVTGNVVPITINGRSYSTTYASSSDATLQALATAIATDQDVASATVTVVGGNQTGTDDRVITITSKGSLQLNITGTTVTGGASQPGVTIAQTQAAVQNAVDVHQFGPMGGFTSLTVGDAYYLSSTAGAITNIPPSGNPVYVGRAESATYLFVDPNGLFTSKWGSSKVVVRSHGSSTGAVGGGTQDVEHYNLTSWLTGTPSTAGARMSGSKGDTAYGNRHHYIDGNDTGGSVTALFVRYDKASWSTLSNRTTARVVSGVNQYNSFLYSMQGSTTGASAANVTTNDKWNGTTWAVATAWANAYHGMGNFVVSNLLSDVGGLNTAGTYVAAHQQMNTSEVESGATVYPVIAFTTGGNNSSSSGILINGNGSNNNGTSSHSWNGSSWSASLTTSYSQVPGVAMGAYHSIQEKCYMNGGSTVAGSNAINSTQSFRNGVWSSETASTNSRTAGSMSVI